MPSSAMIPCMSYQSSEGILLRAIPFRDFDAILTLFTPEGKVNMIKKGWQNRISPLTHVDFTCFAGRSDLLNCRSLSVLNPYLSLRKDLATLEAACEMAKAASDFSVPDQNYKETFQQLLKCFAGLPKANDPQTLVSWFRLYILESEGLLPEKLQPASDFRPDPQTQKEIKNLFNNYIR